ncbi:retrovirus-related pol polyprotein from transposon TNT 1-94 [Tanacetum coccineum]
MNKLVNDGIKLLNLEINTGFINGLPKKWLAFCQSLRNKNHVKESKLASLFGKLKYEENLINSIYDTNQEKTLVPTTPLSTASFSSFIVQDFQDSPDDEEDSRSRHSKFSSAKATDQTECHKCGKKGHFARDCWSKTSVPSYQSPFQPKLLHSSEHKPEPRHTKDFEAKYNKVKAKLALLSSSASAPSSSSGKNKGLIAESYDWDEEEVSSDDNDVTEVKALMALADEERVSVGKESARNGEWIKISMKKVHTLLEMEDNDDRKSFLDYLCIDLNYVEEQRNNLMSKHRNLVQELNTCKEQLLVLKQAKLDLLTMQHVNTEILKENQNLRNELKELTSITEAWLNSSNKVNQCISEQIPTQKKKILGIDQLTEDTSSSGPKDPVFVKSSADNSEVSITGSNKPKLSEAEDSTLSNHDTGKPLDDPTFKRMIVELGVNTFRNAIGAHYLPHSSEYVAPPSIDIVRPWFETIGYGEVVPAKGTLKKSLLSPRWSLANGINIDYASIFWEDIIIKLNKKHREKVVPYTRFLSLLMMHKMKEGYGDRELTLYPTQWSLKLLKPLPKLRVFPKEQSLELNLDTRSFQLLQNNPLCPAKMQQKVREEEASITIKLEDLAKLVSHVQPSFKDLDFPEDDPVIVVDDNLPSKFNELTEEVKGLKQQVHELEIELPGDLKEIPSKLKEFTKTITSLLLNVIKALNKFAQVLESVSSKARDQSVPLAGQADTMPAEGEKKHNTSTISLFFQRRAEKYAWKET